MKTSQLEKILKDKHYKCPACRGQLSVEVIFENGELTEVGFYCLEDWCCWAGIERVTKDEET